VANPFHAFALVRIYRHRSGVVDLCTIPPVVCFAPGNACHVSTGVQWLSTVLAAEWLCIIHQVSW
jgi:hypothetical protein